MNVDNGHLIDRDQVEMTEEHMDERGYMTVPDKLKRAARYKLNGKAEATVSLTSGGRLARWAAQVRQVKKTRRRNKIARQSRKANR